jgi:hypothetical protein
MKRNTRDRLLAGALLLLLLGSLTGCKKGEETGELPEQYTVDGEEIAALPTEGEEEEVTVSVEETDTGASYTYAGLSAPGQVSEDYAALLTEGDTPFAPVDEDCVETELPDFTAAEGQMLLARTREDGETVCAVQVDWTEDNCTVTVDTREGAVTLPGEKLTLINAAAYLQSFQPAQLGLTGSSMAEYQIYALDGAVFVDGSPCLHLKVCRVADPDSANEISGDFLITGDKRHLYSLDEAAGTVEELHF